jgi:hypothetical protein
MTQVEGQVSRRTGAHPGSLALATLGAVMGFLGAAGWAFDADPTRSKLLLALGAIVTVASRFVGHRLSRRGQRVLLVVVAIAALLVVVDAIHLIQVINDQRASHAA